MINSNYYKFQHGAMSIIQMGEELIGHPTTAINELVKNAYDADAFDCWVYINHDSNIKNTFIVLFDNGTGMNHELLFGDWLKPSISPKRIGIRKSPILERNYLGKKGIGRLAALALGQYLTVISKTYSETEYNWITINRESFRQEGLLDAISFPGGKINSVTDLLKDEMFTELKGTESSSKLKGLIENKEFVNFKEGTLIVIENVDEAVLTIINKDIEDNRTFDSSAFHRSLRFLITPLKLNDKIQDDLLNENIITSKIAVSKPESFFDIHFGLNVYEDSGLIDNVFQKIEELPILSEFDYRLFGKVENNGAINGKFICQRLPQFSFTEPFIMDYNETLTSGGVSTKPENLTNSSGSFIFDIRVYDREDDCTERLSKVLKTKGKQETGRTLNSILGLRISKNSFNIKPYGEEQKDWMDLGHLRVQNPTEVIDKNQILGNIILFSPQNDSLEEKTNREGFFENKAFIDLKAIMRSALLELGKRRYRYRVKHGIGRIVTSKFKRPDSVKFIDFLKKSTTDIRLIKKAEQFVSETNTTLENLENSLSFSERLAALGNGLELVYHELAQPISLLGSSLSTIEYKVKDKINDLQLRQDLLTNTLNSSNNLISIDELRKSLQPAIGKTRPSYFYPYKTFQKVRLLHNQELKEKNIKIWIEESSKQKKIYSYEFVFWISFLNIFNNAVYWLDEIDVNQRQINFIIHEDYTIEISNTSVEIPPDYIESIFEYGVTFKKTKNATGLGLAYTRSQLNKIDYEIWAENKEFGPSFFIKKANNNG